LRFSRGPSRDFGVRACPEPRTVTRTRLDSLQVAFPYRVFYCPTSSAFLASGAPPTTFRRPRGFPRRTLPRNVSPAVFPLGVRSSPESCELRLRPLVPSPVKPLQEGAGSFQDRAGPPLMGFLLPRTQLRRVPLLRRALPCSRTRGTRIARPSSVPSSGFLPLSTVSAVSRLARGLLDPAVRRGPQRFAAFFHAARVPGAPLQSFPFPGSRTRSRGPSASLRVSLPGCRRRGACRVFATTFPNRASPSPLAPARRRTRDSWTGTFVPRGR
jgi:hypothetical protein